MKFRNLSTKDAQTLREKFEKSCEAWAKSPTLHPTVDTYSEAFFKGIKAALSLPEMPRLTAYTVARDISNGTKDDAHADRAWKTFFYGDAETAEDALALTEEAGPSSDPDPDEKTSPAGAQEPADPDKEDAE